MTSQQEQLLSLDHYLRKTVFKTASLMANSCQAVALLGAQPQPVSQLAWHYGHHLGLAFQVGSPRPAMLAGLMYSSLLVWSCLVLCPQPCCLGQADAWRLAGPPCRRMYVHEKLHHGVGTRRLGQSQQPPARKVQQHAAACRAVLSCAGQGCTFSLSQLVSHRASRFALPGQAPSLHRPAPAAHHPCQPSTAPAKGPHCAAYPMPDSPPCQAPP